MAMTTTTTITTKSNANANAKSESAREEKNREKNHYYCMTKVTKTDTIRCIASENRRCRNSFIQTHTHNFRLFMLHFLFRILWRSLVSFPFTSFVFNCCFIYTLCTHSLSLACLHLMRSAFLFRFPRFSIVIALSLSLLSSSSLLLHNLMLSVLLSFIQYVQLLFGGTVTYQYIVCVCLYMRVCVCLRA